MVATFLHEYWHVLSDPAHLATEITIEIFTGLLALLPFRRWIRRHDRKQHGQG